LALRLHSLMAGVQDGARLVEAQQARLESARTRYSVALSALQNGRQGAAEAEAARAELERSLAELSSTLAALRSSFEELVGELKALGLPSGGLAASAAQAPETVLGLDP